MAGIDKSSTSKRLATRRSMDSLQSAFARYSRANRTLVGQTAYNFQDSLLVNEDTAMTLPAVLSAVRQISNRMSMLPLCVKKRNPDGSSEAVTDHPLCKVLSRSWDQKRTAALYTRRQAVGYCLTWGQAISEIVYGTYGDVVALNLVHPSRTRACLDSDGNLFYSVQGQGKSNSLDLPPDKVLHFRNYSLDGLNGQSPISLGKNAISLGLAMEAYSLALFVNSANQRGFYKTTTQMTPDQLKEFRETVDDTHGGPEKANKFGVLHGGMDWVPTSLSPENAQLILSRTFSIQDVARLFDIPPHLLAELSRATFSNIEEQNLQFLQMTLQPWAEAIEAEMNLKLFTDAEQDAGYYVEHDMSSLMRGNTVALTQQVVSLVSAGVWNRDEGRAKFGMAPIPDGSGKQFLTQINQDTIDNIVDAPAPPEAGNSKPAPDDQGDNSNDNDNSNLNDNDNSNPALPEGESDDSEQV